MAAAFDSLHGGYADIGDGSTIHAPIPRVQRVASGRVSPVLSALPIALEGPRASRGGEGVKEEP